MSDLKRQAHAAYVKQFTYHNTVDPLYGLGRKKQRTEEQEEIHLLIVQFLCTVQPQERFGYPQFSNIITNSANMDSFNPGKAAEAFGNLETYILLLCLMPWKQEFLQIKKYGGFYQTKIESHLSTAESVFGLIGYIEASDIAPGILLLKPGCVPPLDFLLIVAFECFIAAVECRIIEDIWKRTLQTGVTLKQIVMWRTQRQGNVDSMVTLITTEYNSELATLALQNVHSNNRMNNIVRRSSKSDKNKSDNRGDSAISNGSVNDSTDKFRTKLNNHLLKVKTIEDNMEDIPFMDETVKEAEHTPGNFDEHLFASLQLVGEKNSDKHENTKASQEWSFVKDELEAKYGKKYFEGPRKDILQSEGKPTAHGPGYVKIVTQDPSHKYVNFGQVMDNIPEHKQLTNCRLPSDSAYNSEGLSYPPTLDGRGPSGIGSPLPFNGVPTSVSGRPGLQTSQRLTNSEPIVKRHVAQPPPPAHDMAASPYSYAQNPPELALNSIVNMDNIQRCVKPSAGPLVTRQRLSGSDKYPSSGKQVTVNRRSYSEVHKRNVADSIPTMISPNTVNIPVHGTGGNLNNTVVNSNFNASDSVNKWSCTYCTYLNEQIDIVCGICYKSRVPVETDSPPVQGQTSKVCVQCTLENEIGAEACHACGHLLGGTHTVV